VVVRVAEPGRPAFQLRKGEEGLSVFDLDAVKPPLTEAEILDAFRADSVTIARSNSEIGAKGLSVVPIPGAGTLPRRLQEAHAEIRPGAGMTRTEFKRALQELE